MIKRSSLPTISLLCFLMSARSLPTIFLRWRVKFSAVAKSKQLKIVRTRAQSTLVNGVFCFHFLKEKGIFYDIISGF